MDHPLGTGSSGRNTTTAPEPVPNNVQHRDTVSPTPRVTSAPTPPPGPPTTSGTRAMERALTNLNPKTRGAGPGSPTNEYLAEGGDPVIIDNLRELYAWTAHRAVAVAGPIQWAEVERVREGNIRGLVSPSPMNDPKYRNLAYWQGQFRPGGRMEYLIFARGGRGMDSEARSGPGGILGSYMSGYVPNPREGPESFLRQGQSLPGLIHLGMSRINMPRTEVEYLVFLNNYDVLLQGYGLSSEWQGRALGLQGRIGDRPPGWDPDSPTTGAMPSGIIPYSTRRPGFSR